MPEYPPPLSAVALDVLESTARTILAATGQRIEAGMMEELPEEARHAYLWLRLVGMIRKASPEA